MTNLSLPQNVEAEQAVLGAVLIRGDLINSVFQILTKDDFYKEAHRKIFDAMIELNKVGKPIDIVTLFDFMKSRGQLLEDVGGSPYLTYLTEVVPTTVNVEYYAQMVKNKSVERSISELCIATDHEIKNNKIDLNNAITRLQNFIDNITISNHSGNIVSLGNQNEPPPRKWLLESLIPLNSPTLEYGLGGTGKSYFALDLAILTSLGGQKLLDYNFYDEPTNTLYVDYELDEEELTRRAFEISRGHQLTNPPKNLFYYSPKNNISKFLKELNSIIRCEHIKFVIVDSLGASRLDSSDEIEVIERFEELRDSGVTSLLLDHHSKMQAQENIETKTPFGSIYKFNMARSVLHLVLDKTLENGITLRLLHKKSNFGRLQPEMLIDIIFDKDSVMICKSKSVSQEVEQMLLIQDAMVKMLKNDGYEEINQNHIIERLKGIIGKDKLISLLRKGKDKYWLIVKGEKGSSLIYIPILEEFQDLITKFGNSNIIYNQNIRISNKGGDDDGLEPPPNFLE